MTEISQLVKQTSSRDSLSTYIYHALPDDAPATRLLVLEPGGSGDSLQGSLIACQLNWWLPQYEAISYCWGDTSQGSRSYNIILDGKPLPVTPNAHDALVYSRSTTRVTRLWLDQLCINQEDSTERAEQIKYMDLIYSKATTVIIHLGPASDSHEMLFDFLHIVDEDIGKSALLTARWWNWRRVLIPPTSPLTFAFRDGTHLLPQTLNRLQTYESRIPEMMDALLKLFTLPWFTRVWVVQEAALAHRLLVRLGSKSATWEALYTAVMGLDHYLTAKVINLPNDAVAGFLSMHAIGMVVGEIQTAVTWYDVYVRLSQLFDSRHEYTARQLLVKSVSLVSAGQRIPVLNLLREFRHQEATDKRDKIFGILGLTYPDDVQTGFLSRLTDSRNFMTCFFHFATMHITHTGTLDVLSASCYGAEAHEPLPHWCPDWSFKKPVCDTQYTFGAYNTPPHCAGTRKSARIGLIDIEDGSHGQPLVVEGFQIDEVEAVVDDLFNVRTFKDPTHPLWDSWRSFALLKGDSDPYCTDEERWEAYWRTLVYDFDGRGFASVTFGEIIKPFLTNSDTCTEKIKQKFAGRFTWCYRKLYRTRRGYLGNGCSNVKPGDKIFICHGGRFPLILREFEFFTGKLADGGWNNVGAEVSLMRHELIGGDTFIYGLCKGEAFEIAESESIEPGMVCLR